MSSLDVTPPALAGLAGYSPELDSFLRREMASARKACDSLSRRRSSPVVDIISKEFAEHKKSPRASETNYVEAASNEVAQIFRHFLIACDNVQAAVAARRSDQVALEACDQVNAYMGQLYSALLYHLEGTTAQHPALRRPAPARHSAPNSLGRMRRLEEEQVERALNKRTAREGRYRRELIYAGRRY
ncbi:hypothetical protein JCM8208_007187 [Rhodotorula glutinis]